MFSLSQDTTLSALPLILLNKLDLEDYRKSASHFVINLLDGQGFDAEYGSICRILNKDGQLESALIGVENPPDDPRNTCLLFAKIASSLPSSVNWKLQKHDWSQSNWEQAALGWGLASYKFTRYLNKPAKPIGQFILPVQLDMARLEHQLEAIFLARDLINTPALDLSPADLVNKVRETGALFGAEVTAISGQELLEQNYPAIHAVGMGSAREPALADLRWGNPKHPLLTIVGKGVVFDTGGLNLKNDTGMLAMKKDMGGAAVALGMARLIMAEQLPVRLRLLIPTVENSPSGTAYRPGDIIATRKGLRIEIGNTDAEGRIILCDALAEAVSEVPDLLLDFATLTGACRIALGGDLPGFWTPSNLGPELQACSWEVGDPLWQMPLWAPYRKNLESPIADLNNAASTPLGGAINAAVYLHEFVKPFANWIHFDVFGWRNESLPGFPKGGEATALIAVFEFLSRRYSKNHEASA